MEFPVITRLVTSLYLCSICVLIAYVQTRSGKAFGQWEGPTIFALTPTFDFEKLLQNAVKKEIDGNFNSDDEAVNESDDEADNGSDGDRPSPAEPIPTLPTTPPIPNLNAKDRRRTRKKSQGHSCRNKKRQKTCDESFSHHEHSMRIHRKYIANCQPIVTPMSSANSGVARSAYIGLRDQKPTQTVHRLEDLVGPQSEFGFRLIEWDGRSISPSLFSEKG